MPMYSEKQELLILFALEERLWLLMHKNVYKILIQFCLVTRKPVLGLIYIFHILGYRMNNSKIEGITKCNDGFFFY